MGFIIATLIVLVVIASVVAQDFSVFSWAYWQEGDTSTSRSEVVRNVGLLAAAVIGLGVGSWRAYTAYLQTQASQRQAEAANEQARAANEQARIAQQGHITERFSRAVEQLGHDRVAVRIGGLYALKRIAEDSVERDHLAVMDVLTNFIRQPPYTDAQREAAEREKTLRTFRTNSAKENAEADQIDRADQTAGAALPPPEPELIDCPDIVAAIEIIQRRSEDQKELEDELEYRLSLSRASLSYLRLLEVDLRYFDLARADLTGADLTRAHLTGAILTRANLRCAYLMEAHLTHAHLTDADLTGADLGSANLTRADLGSANLTRADLTRADLTGAKNLTQQQLDGIRYDPDNPPELPPGLVLPEPPPEPEPKSAAAQSQET